MSASFFSRLVKSHGSEIPARRRIGVILGFSVWTIVSFVAAQILVVAFLYALKGLGVSFAGINNSVLNGIVAAGTYTLSLAIVIGVPLLVKSRDVTTKRDVGLWRLPSWTDIGLAPVGFVVYFLPSAILLSLATAFVPGFDSTQPQEIGFDNLSQNYEYILAFMTLVIVAPLAEEVLFRGYLYGKLKKYAPVWLGVLVTSLVFASLHLPSSGSLQWNVAIDVFVLSIVLCALREITGSIWAGVLLHMLKNGIAFYLLFIYPHLAGTIGG